MDETVLVTGASGLIGRSLVPLLKENGYRVRILTSGSKPAAGVEVATWDPGKDHIDPAALDDVKHIIHLAGTSIGNGRWTGARKRSIISSRVDGARLLLREIVNRDILPGTFISASAIGYYGAVSGSRIFEETDLPGSDFGAYVCTEWEKAAGYFMDHGIRTVVIRTGIVLSPDGGMLGRLMPSIRLRFSPLLGNGSQYVPWIHLADIANIYLQALQNDKMHGVFNGVAPEATTYREMVRSLAAASGKKVFAPPTPSFPWKILFGEKSAMLLNGCRISSEKITVSGYKFIYPELDAALKDLLKL